jgi:phosphatidylinositol glycan class B
MLHRVPRWVYLTAVLVRVLAAVGVQTYFNPDEYWQSLEVAHRTVFGYGFLTWEWKEPHRIRGFLHPAIFAVLYKLLQMLGWDTPWACAYAPRLLQALFNVVGDVFLHKLAHRWFGVAVAKWTVSNPIVCLLFKGL